MPAYPKPEPKKKTKKRQPKKERQILEEYLDDLVRQIVKIRDKQTCVICGSTSQPQAGHFFVRDRMGTRWDLRNVNCQCASCNLYHRFDQQPYTRWFKTRFGNEEYERLYQLAESRPYYKWEIIELYDAIPGLEAELIRLATSLPEDKRIEFEGHVIDDPYNSYLERFSNRGHRARSDDTP